MSMTDAALEAWGSAAQKYTIHEETLKYFCRTKELGVKGYDEQTPEELRGATLRRSELFAGHASFTGSEIEYVVPSDTNEEGVPVSVYKPSDVSQTPAIWVYFHGGGLVTGSRTSYAPVLKTFARRARCIVVNVEYRLAPEYKAPAAFEDCRCATRWVLDHKSLIGGSEDSQVGIGGDSAGGQLAASVGHDVQGLAFQILVYPVTNLTLSVPSFDEFAVTPGLNTSSVKWFMKQFLVEEKQIEDPIVSPYNRPSFTGLPPALFIIAELDPLRDDGLAYAHKLQDAGVSTEILLVKGAPHVFFHLSAHFKELTKEPHERVVEFLKKFQKE